MRDSGQRLTIALPSKGNLEEPTLAFMAECNLRVERLNPREYEAGVAGRPDMKVIFQRTDDIPSKVEEEIADLGIAGYDLLMEYKRETDRLAVLMENLGYGRCALVLAVPESWVDVQTLGDLADLATLFKERGGELRVATKFPSLTWQFLHDHGIHYFSLVESHGAIELAPAMGFADIISDLTTSGVTLRDNRLKTIQNGTILRSEACLIGNLHALRGSRAKLRQTRYVLEAFESRRRAQEYYSITANLRGASEEAVADHLIGDLELAGMKGPTIAKVYAKERHERDWYAVSVVVKKALVDRAIAHLRAAGGSGITVSKGEFVFADTCTSYERLSGLLKHWKEA